jgi:hypothetical protein
MSKANQAYNLAQAALALANSLNQSANKWQNISGDSGAINGSRIGYVGMTGGTYSGGILSGTPNVSYGALYVTTSATGQGLQAGHTYLFTAHVMADSTVNVAMNCYQFAGATNNGNTGTSQMSIGAAWTRISQTITLRSDCDSVQQGLINQGTSPYTKLYMKDYMVIDVTQFALGGADVDKYGGYWSGYPNLAATVTKWNGKNVLCVGDSLTAAGLYQQTVASYHNCTTTTHALGGIDLVGMVAGTTNGNGTIPALATSDVTGKDLIILFGGMNERSTSYGTQFMTSPTTAPTNATATNGGSLAAGTYYTKYTWVSSAGGETAASPESSSITTTGSTSTITVTVPALPAGCTQTNIYIGTASGSEYLQGSTTGTTYTQTAALLTADPAPTISTALCIYPSSNTLFGKMQYAITTIYNLLVAANNLTCKILVVVPHCPGKYGYIDVDGYGEYPVGTGQTLEKLVNNLITSANYNNLRVVDLWHKSGVGRNTWSVYMASSSPTLGTPNPSQTYPNNADQVHFNNTGYALIGQIIAEEMNML